jgi:FtsH-binding integral membrane protein
VPFFPPDPFAPSQIVGYVAFVLGIVAFMQKNDRRLKILNAAQTLVYALHYLMLGLPVAAGGAAVASVRSAVAARIAHPAAWMVWLFVGLTLGIGAIGAKAPQDWLSVAGWSLGTITVMRFSGITLRFALIVSSGLVFSANLLSGSIGGAALEFCIAAANLITAVRLLRDRRREALG